MSNFKSDDNHPKAQYGDGISHALKGTKTKQYKLLVRGSQMSEMKVVLRAETKRQAIKYGKARWPGAAVEVVK